MDTKEQNFPKWEELTKEQQFHTTFAAMADAMCATSSFIPINVAELLNGTYAGYNKFTFDDDERASIERDSNDIGRRFYNRLTRHAVDNYIEDYTDEAEQEAKVITAKAKLTKDAIGQLSTEIMDCKKRILGMSFGLGWYEANMPLLGDSHKKLEQWQSEDDFPEFIHELLVIHWLEKERNALFSPDSKDELKKDSEIRLNNLKNKWFLVEDKDALIEKIRKQIINGKGSRVYSIIRALEDNGQLKQPGNREITELHSLFSSLFGNIGTRKSLGDASNKFKENPDGCYVEDEISNLAQLLK